MALATDVSYIRLGGEGSRPNACEVGLGKFRYVLGRPVGYIHAKVEPYLGQHFLDRVKRLAAEVRDPQHVTFGSLHEVADVDDTLVLEAVRRTH